MHENPSLQDHLPDQTDATEKEPPQDDSLDKIPEEAPEVRQARIRTQNDIFRQTGQGGLLYLTAGVNELGPEAVEEIRDLIRSFNDFTPENDPWGEHDCALVEWRGQKLIWKIDYYDKSLKYGSPDASDLRLTERVMTIMFSHEY